MRRLCLILSVLLASCGGNLSTDERKKLHDASKRQEIVRVTEAEIAEAALEQGRNLTDRAMALKGNPAGLDSLGRSHHASVRWVQPGATNALGIEQQIIEAYVMNPSEDLPDNIQDMGEDSILYSRPQVSKLPDGTIMVEGMWSVALSRKDIILRMTEE